MATRIPQKWTPHEIEQYFRDTVAEYRGDSYLVDDLVESGLTIEAAQKEVQDLEVLKAFLECDGLPGILADRLAAMALKNAVLAGREDVIEALISATRKLKVPKKRGPKAKMVEGEYLYQRVARLKKEGKSYGKIAQIVYLDRSPEKINLVKAQYRQARGKLALVAVAARE